MGNRIANELCQWINSGLRISLSNNYVLCGYLLFSKMMSSIVVFVRDQVRSPKERQTSNGQAHVCLNHTMTISLYREFWTLNAAKETTDKEGIRIANNVEHQRVGLTLESISWIPFSIRSILDFIIGYASDNWMLSNRVGIINYSGIAAIPHWTSLECCWIGGNSIINLLHCLPRSTRRPQLGSPILNWF